MEVEYMSDSKSDALNEYAGSTPAAGTIQVGDLVKVPDFPNWGRGLVLELLVGNYGPRRSPRQSAIVYWLNEGDLDKHFVSQFARICSSGDRAEDFES